MLNIFAGLALAVATAVGGSYFLKHRGKAKIGDTVQFYYTPGGPFGTQRLELLGKVIEKTDPITGPFYTIQMLALPKNLSPEIMAAMAQLPSSMKAVPDKDITNVFGPNMEAAVNLYS